MMDYIMQEFKSSIFYRELFVDRDILCVYVGGSRCTRITDEKSDYDIIIITKNGTYEDVNEFAHIRYKEDIKIHWYYIPIGDLFNESKYSAITGVQIRNLSESIILYINPEYDDVIDSLMKVKYQLSNISCYRFFDINRDYVENIIQDNCIAEKHYSKFLYHLCLASYYLLQEIPDADFLKSLKRIRWQPVSDEYKQLALERLKIYKNYIEQNPIDIKETLKDLYKKLAD